MFKYIIKRLLQAIPLLIGVSIIAFSIMHLAPGGPLSVYTLNPSITAQDIDKIKVILGLDQPVHIQYLKWAKGMFTGNWGTTFFGGRPVFDVIVERIPATFLLMGSAMSIAIIIGMFTGILGAFRRYSVFDYLATTGAMVALSFPTFWFGLMAIYIFSLKLGWFPSGGMFTLGGEEDIFDLLRHLVLPTFVLALVLVAQWSRYTRSSFLEVIHQDYIRTAKAKGIKGSKILFRHALPNAVAPLIALAGVQLPWLFSGALVAETIFGWPGMGRLFVDSLTMKEYPILMGMVMFTAIAVIIGNLIADILNAVLDPRIALE
ncbi:MAG: ABC transporter permease [Desulfobacula sp.]|uniref:ABC transporter permease n=2 Tax=Desulfobacula sp. TaxID=2593537 RepID=UPI001ECC9A47|nr:ABC transporter permease [Desulfobacula sp.]MBT4201421.1 ABC transporter permease [Desulfobacula sp.]MBT4877205.1 ABC transporter permease [Desulfobacula sp.]MBT5546190.1 ABC transporter permease [Desulfobacula sp.]MBT7794320.1 ABC transporter permease [Desulfobacula sp.]